jgi:release factor glutamine methyltransferase
MNLSIAESILAATQTLRRAGVPEARREAGSLLEYVIVCDRTFIITHADHLISEEQLEKFRECVSRRAKGEPLQYITGHQAFYGLDFEVTKDVLIPRPETELLVEATLSLARDLHTAPLICDVGTGSGCVTVALLRELPGAQAIGIDISEAAIRVAERNAALHSVNERVTFLVSDCLSALSSHKAGFDFVVSNPPYVNGSAMDGLQREVRDHEPRMALTPGSDGLSVIKRLLSESLDVLKPGGYLLMEIGFDQGSAVQSLANREVWDLLDIHQDLQSIPRIVALQKRAQ